MFPTSQSRIYYNEAGEVLGWDEEPDPNGWYCDDCGFSHGGECEYPFDEDEEE